MLAWDDLKAEFTWEGSWRDICVTGTSIADWRAALEMIHAAGFRLKFMTDGAESTPPDNLLQVFNQPRECSFMLAAFVGGVQLNCHFFGESEIEFDLDPREVVGQAELDAVVTFMSKLAASTQKSALMLRRTRTRRPSSASLLRVSSNTSRRTAFFKSWPPEDPRPPIRRAAQQGVAAVNRRRSPAARARYKGLGVTDVTAAVDAVRSIGGRVDREPSADAKTALVRDPHNDPVELTPT